MVIHTDFIFIFKFAVRNYFILTMKNILSAFLVAGLLASCSQANKEETSDDSKSSLSYFGDTITEENAKEATQLVALIGDQSKMDVKLTGTIDQVCQKKGCWMDVNMGNNQTLKVRFKDYAFFVPKDAAGKTVIMEGEAFHDTVTVAQLRHYAEDAGKSKEEIEKITEPEISINFEAKGVIIK